MIRHVVLMTFTDPADVPAARNRLEQLADRIDAVRTLEVLLDTVGAPGASHLALLTTHDDADGLREYAAHPAHEEFLTWVRPRLAARAVLDAEV